jgi:hypothetical protein
LVTAPASLIEQFVRLQVIDGGNCPSRDLREQVHAALVREVETAGADDGTGARAAPSLDGNLCSL